MAEQHENKPNLSNRYVGYVLEIGERLGVDALIFILAVAAWLIALRLNAPPLYAWGLAATIVVGWVTNNGIKAFVYRSEMKHALDMVKATQGRELLQRHQERQESLPLANPKQNSSE